MFINGHYFTFGTLCLTSVLGHSHVKETIFLERSYQKEHTLTRVQDLAWIQLNITGRIGAEPETKLTKKNHNFDLALPLTELQNEDTLGPSSTVIDHNIREFMNTHPNVGRLHMSMSQGAVGRNSYQNELLLPANLATIEVLLSIPSDFHDTPLIERMTEDVMKHANAVADANLGTGFQVAEGYRSSHDPKNSLVTLYNEFQDDKLCTENLWRIYKMFPCRSLAGAMVTLSPKSFAASRMKSIDVIVTRNGSMVNQIVNVKMADDGFEDPQNEVTDTLDLDSAYLCPLVENFDLLVRDGSNERFMNLKSTTVDRSLSLAKLWTSQSEEVTKSNFAERMVSLGHNGRLHEQETIEVRVIQLFEGRTQEITHSTLNYVLTAPKTLDSIKVQFLQHLTQKMRPLVQRIEVACDHGKIQRPEIYIEDIAGPAIAHRESLRSERILRLKFNFSGKICRLKVPIIKDSPIYDEMLSNYEFGQTLTSPYVQMIDSNFSEPIHFKSLSGAKVSVPYMNILFFFQIMTMSSLGYLIFFSRSVRTAIA